MPQQSWQSKSFFKIS